MTEPPLLLRIADVVARRAGPADAATLGRLRAVQRAELRGGEPTEIERFAADCEAFFARELATERPWLHAWLAVAGHDVVGCAALMVFPTLPRLGAKGRFDGRVRDVYVAPAHRRRGIARGLLSLVLEEARRQDIDRLALGASVAGRPLYEALGFVAKDDEMLYVMP